MSALARMLQVWVCELLEVTSVTLWYQPRVQEVFERPFELKQMSELEDLQKDKRGAQEGIDMKE
ncbi:hypothetical protein PAL_GLEAN10010102 [Pteropus alecto]|uniref:Uncharacterized protein n=1 Tax=Pteropus alecto TaxID=9402 RepID=L5JXE1_PTEAL|nr:hypothetical protein PAL_GLEAN10010102 [Pteropus alecto]